jgi:hypothetical protein
MMWITKKFGLIDFDKLTMAEVDKRMAAIKKSGWKESVIAKVKADAAKKSLPYNAACA